MKSKRIKPKNTKNISKRTTIKKRVNKKGYTNKYGTRVGPYNRKVSRFPNSYTIYRMINGEYRLCKITRRNGKEYIQVLENRRRAKSITFAEAKKHFEKLSERRQETDRRFRAKNIFGEDAITSSYLTKTGSSRYDVENLDTPPTKEEQIDLSKQIDKIAEEIATDMKDKDFWKKYRGKEEWEMIEKEIENRKEWRDLGKANLEKQLEENINKGENVRKGFLKSEVGSEKRERYSRILDKLNKENFEIREKIREVKRKNEEIKLKKYKEKANAISKKEDNEAKKKLEKIKDKIENKNLKLQDAKETMDLEDGYSDKSRIFLITTNKSFYNSGFAHNLEENNIEIPIEKSSVILTDKEGFYCFGEKPDSFYRKDIIDNALKTMDNPKIYYKDDSNLLIQDDKNTIILAPRISFDPAEDWMPYKEYQKYDKLNKRELIKETGDIYPRNVNKDTLIKDTHEIRRKLKDIEKIEDNEERKKKKLKIIKNKFREDLEKTENQTWGEGYTNTYGSTILIQNENLEKIDAFQEDKKDFKEEALPKFDYHIEDENEYFITPNKMNCYKKESVEDAMNHLTNPKIQIEKDSDIMIIKGKDYSYIIAPKIQEDFDEKRTEFKSNNISPKEYERLSKLSKKELAKKIYDPKEMPKRFQYNKSFYIINAYENEKLKKAEA